MMGEETLLREAIEFGAIGLLAVLGVAVALHLYRRLWALEKLYTTTVGEKAAAEATVAALESRITEVNGRLDDCITARGSLEAHNEMLEKRVAVLEGRPA